MLDDFLQEIDIEGRVQALAGDALLRRVALEQDQGHLAEQIEILRPVPGLDAAPVFCKRDIQLPVQIVFNAPVMP